MLYATTALAGAVLCWCVCGARVRLGGWGRCHSSSLPPLLSLPRLPQGAFLGLPRPGVPCLCSLVRHSMWSVCSATMVRSPFRCGPPVHSVFLRSRSRTVCMSTPPPALWRAPCARSPQGTLEGPFQVACAPPRFLLRLLALPVVGGRAFPFLFPCSVVGGPGLGTLPAPTVRPWGRRPGRAAGFPWVQGVRALKSVINPTAQALASWLCALRGRQEGARGRAPCASVRGVWCPAHSVPEGCILGADGRGLLPVFRGRGGSGRGDPSATPQRTLLRAGFARVWAVRGRLEGDALLGFAAPGCRCCLALVAVPRLWPAACLFVLPCGPALARRALSRPVALGAPVGFPVVVVPPPTGGFRLRFYWVAARGTWRSALHRANGACRGPLPWQGRWASSASYLFRAPLLGCPWQVPLTFVLS